jgi:hypothetical protein
VLSLGYDFHVLPVVIAAAAATRSVAVIMGPTKRTQKEATLMMLRTLIADLDVR